MAKHVPWDCLLAVIGWFPEGLSLKELMLGIDLSVSRRTLQRGLARLVHNKSLAITGVARSRCYKLPHTPEAVELPSPSNLPFQLAGVRELLHQI